MIEANTSAFKNAMSTYNWDLLLTNCDDSNDLFTIFHNSLCGLYEQICPIKQFRISKKFLESYIKLNLAYIKQSFIKLYSWPLRFQNLAYIKQNSLKMHSWSLRFKNLAYIKQSFIKMHSWSLRFQNLADIKQSFIKM